MKYVFKMIIVFLALGMSSMSGCKKAASFENENITIEHTLKKPGNNLKKKHKETSKSSSALLLPEKAFSTLTAAKWMARSSMPQVLDKPMSAAEVSYVLRKIGFEPSPSEVSQWIGQNRSTLITNLIAKLDAKPVIDFPEWTKFEPRYWGQQDWPENKRSAFRSSRRQEIAELRQWWIKQMLATNSPFAERLVLFWENTFVAGFSGLDEKSHAQWMHHKTIRRYALGNYRELLHSMIKDPAILIYLDNNRNERVSPNENLARELFELFTLGEGNYSENDIKEAARALAGWHVSEFGKISFLENAWARDFTKKKIFGVQKKIDGEELVELILLHPKSSEFVVKNFWSEFISLEPIPKDTLLHWSDAFRKTNYEISELLTVILNSSYFWDEKYRGTSVKSPSELLVGMVRMSQNSDIPLSVLDARLADMGQTLFDPPDVSGWGYGEYWIDAAKLIEREQFQKLFFQTLSSEFMTENSMKNTVNSRMLDEKAPKKIRLKLAGEAYQGAPPYRVSIKHSGGQWFSKINYLNSARDTERLGRYKDESQWVWETISLEVPDEVNDVEEITVRFTTDAAGNGGDRNLFIGSVEWQEITLPGSLGIQSPGCRSDSGGAQRHPDKLYCVGELTLHWKKIINQFVQEERKAKQKSEFETNELVLLWLNSPSKGGWQSIDLMFDGLSFKERDWDYFGFKVVLDTKNGNHFHLAFDEDRCKPSCFVRWPSGVWKDKLGLRHSVVSFNKFEDWALRQYSGLKKVDKELIKSIISTMPKIRKLVANTLSHREPDSKKIWLERMNEFERFAKMKRWKPNIADRLFEKNFTNPDQTKIKTDLQSMMSNTTLEDKKYIIASGKALLVDEWHEKLETYLKLASEPLESWMLSHYEGPRLTDLREVIMSPYVNIK
jgi:uncharacterized protein (DUF1800 family)